MDRIQPWGKRLSGLLLLVFAGCFPELHIPSFGRSELFNSSADTSDAGLDGSADAQVLLPEPLPPLPPPPAYPDYAAHADDAAEVKIGIESPERLTHYYEQLMLAEMEVPGAIARAGHWGDSVLGGDGLTGKIRSLLQDRFGDAGHGYHALGKYNRWYRHRGVRYKEKVDWDTCMIIYKCRRDMRYGYGGVISVSRGGGRSWWATTKKGPGQKVSKFQVLYGKHKKGGRFDIRVDGKKYVTVDTRSNKIEGAVATVVVEDGAHQFEVVARGHGIVRGYGVILERDVPGAVWDELSLIGSFTQRLDYQNAEHISGQLRLRDSNLMVFFLGGNDVSRERTDLKNTMAPYEVQYARVIDKFRAGKPETSCLIMALIDHVRLIRGKIRTREIMPRLVNAQRKVALEHGCAFFDTWQAMGGDGSFMRWHDAKPRLAAKDLHHPTVAGQRKLATLLYQALMQGYVRYRKRMAGQPLSETLAARLQGVSSVEASLRAKQVLSKQL